MNFIMVFIILVFIYMAVGLVDHLLNIYEFFKKDDEEDEIEESNKTKLEE